MLFRFLKPIRAYSSISVQSRSETTAEENEALASEKNSVKLRVLSGEKTYNSKLITQKDYGKQTALE